MKSTYNIVIGILLLCVLTVCSCSEQEPTFTRVASTPAEDQQVSESGYVRFNLILPDSFLNCSEDQYIEFFIFEVTTIIRENFGDPYKSPFLTCHEGSFIETLQLPVREHEVRMVIYKRSVYLIDLPLLSSVLELGEFRTEFEIIPNDTITIDIQPEFRRYSVYAESYYHYMDSIGKRSSAAL